jgi:protein-serine/threonine kinase
MQSQQHQQPQQGYGYAQNAYFPQGQQYQQQQPYGGQQLNDYGNPQANAYQPRSNTPGTNDPNTGLAHQFSHQNLGGAARNAQYNGRGPSPSQRPRTAGATGQQGPPSYANYPAVPSQAASPAQTFQPAPERNPDKYGPNANSNQKKCSQLASDFFKDSVKRARERNQRYILSTAPSDVLCNC